MFRRKLFYLLAVCATLLATQSTEAQTIFFDLEGRAGVGLLPGNELGSISSSGSGGELTGILFNVGTSVLTIDVGWGSVNGFGDLTGNATGMHIHGPADFTSNAGIKYPLSTLTGYDNSLSSGGFNGSVTIDSGDVADLLNGLFYINVHTLANGGGELRGNLVQVVPEPSSMLVLGLSGIAILVRRSRRK